MNETAIKNNLENPISIDQLIKFAIEDKVSRFKIKKEEISNNEIINKIKNDEKIEIIFEFPIYASTIDDFLSIIYINESLLEKCNSSDQEYIYLKFIKLDENLKSKSYKAKCQKGDFMILGKNFIQLITKNIFFDNLKSGNFIVSSYEDVAKIFNTNKEEILQNYRELSKIKNEKIKTH